MIPTTIPMSSPDLTEVERQAVLAVLGTPNLSMGEQLLQFEDSFRRYTGSKFAVGVNSGTAGLHLGVRAFDIGPGDLVITTPFSFVASANVLLFEKAIPIFVDIDPVTGNIDPGAVQQLADDMMNNTPSARSWLPKSGVEDQYLPSPRPLSERLKGILPVDVFGQPCDLDTILKIARQYNLKVIEDSCEALGAEYKGRMAGTLGDLGVYAFYPNKQITTGEGAIIVTDDEHVASMLYALRNQGRAPGDTWLQHTYLGYNYRLDEMSAALGRAQMERIEELLAKRDQVARWYFEQLGAFPWIELPELVPSTTRMSWFVFVIRFADGVDRDLVANELGKQGIPARPYFLPIHLQPYMVQKFGYQVGDFPITESLGMRSLALPFSSVMTEQQVEYVSNHLIDIIKRCIT